MYSIVFIFLLIAGLNDFNSKLGERVGRGGLMILGQMAFSSSCAELSGTRSLRG